MSSAPLCAPFEKKMSGLFYDKIDATDPQIALNMYPLQVAYVGSLTADKAPTLTVEGDPTGAVGEHITLTFIREDSLSRLKEFLLAEMDRSHRLLKDELIAAGTLSNYAPAITADA